MTGGYFGGRCFTSPGEAEDAYYSGVPLVFGNQFAQRLEKTPGGWVIHSHSIGTDGALSPLPTASMLAPSQTFPACDPGAGYDDGMLIGWGIAAATIGAFALAWLAKAAR